MTDKPENPPAFPENTFQKVGDVAVGECDSGMTLRDYFAAAALQGRLAAEPQQLAENNPLCNSYSSLAEDAYAMADAMLRARLP